MAITVGKNTTQTHSWVNGDRVELIVDVTGDTSYPTGGWPVTPSAFGLIELHHIDGADVSGAGVLAYDPVNTKLKVFSAVGTEVTNATNLSTKVYRCRVVGRGKEKIVT